EFIGSKEISFKCNCSRERMLTGVAGLTGSHTIDDIFDGKESLEAKCDYCKTNYLITRDEIINLIQLKH
ncbi:Hsp33 family molecular chaperone HslO, partial [Bacteriovorax sp. DB6_IX]